MSSEPPPNPWLEIPAADYEGHMSLPAVGQLRALSAIFGAACADYRPASVLLLGCATGNGLEQLDPAATRRVLGLDINPRYLELARTRHAARLPQLELHCLDLATAPLPAGPWDLVWAGLIFEYLDPPGLLSRIAAVLAPGGRLVSVLQLPCATVAEISPSPFTSLARLAPAMHLVDVAEFQVAAAAAGLGLESAQVVDLPEGKQFWCGRFQVC